MSETEQELVLHVAICATCKERLEYKKYYAREHLQKYPDHKNYKIVLKEDEKFN